MTLTVGSTFSGIGGADIGFERAGVRVAWQCEIDPWKRSVLQSHWPGIPVYQNITKMCVRDGGDDPEPVDIMIGGFPCQDLSVAGKRKGFSGERSNLAFEFLRIAEHIRPRWIVLENVPGLLTSNGGADFARLIHEMVGCGYGVAWRILDAKYFAVPQRRRRIFIIARAIDGFANPRIASQTALRVIAEGGAGDSTPGWPNAAIADNADRFPANDRGEVIAFGHTHGIDLQADTKVMPTLRRNGRGAAVTYDDHGRRVLRMLTPIECERAMGLPDNWTAPGDIPAPDGKRYAACGDGIVTWVAYWIAKRLIMIDGQTRPND